MDSLETRIINHLVQLKLGRRRMCVFDNQTAIGYFQVNQLWDLLIGHLAKVKCQDDEPGLERCQIEAKKILEMRK